MRFTGVIAVCFVLPCSPVYAELPKPTGDTIVAPDAKLELLFTRSAPINGGLTEGPAVAPDGSIYFSDIPLASDKGMILRFDPQTKATTVFTADSHKSNGLKFDAKGNLIACEGSDEGGRAVVRWDVKTKTRTVIAETYMGKRFNAPNDLTIDTKGRIYFSDPRYLGKEPRELEHRAVYRIDTDRTVVEFTHDVEKPNGLVLSPDQKTLYLADHNNGTDEIIAGKPSTPGAMKVYAFPLGADGLVGGPRKTLVDFGDQAGCDGMTVDKEGHIYLTIRAAKRPGVLVIDPTGKELAFIPTGAPNQSGEETVGNPSNVAFGIGAEKNMLYVTVDVSLYRIPLKMEGHTSHGQSNSQTPKRWGFVGWTLVHTASIGEFERSPPIRSSDSLRLDSLRPQSISCTGAPCHFERLNLLLTCWRLFWIRSRQFRQHSARTSPRKDRFHETFSADRLYRLLPRRADVRKSVSRVALQRHLASDHVHARLGHVLRLVGVRYAGSHYRRRRKRKILRSDPSLGPLSSLRIHRPRKL